MVESGDESGVTGVLFVGCLGIVMRRGFLAVLVVAGLLVAGVPVGASDFRWSHAQELADPNGADLDGLGDSVAMEGDTVVAGAPGDAGTGTDQGAVHVFTRNPSTGVLTHAQELADPNAADGTLLGWSVAIDGDTVVAGAPGDAGAPTDQGAVHVFTRNPSTGVLTHAQELADPNAAAGDRLGWSVAMEGDTLVAGAPGDQGAVHVFTRSPATGVWIHAQELADPNAADGDRLGRSVAIDGDTLVAGAPGDDGAGTFRGAVHVFTRDPSTGVWIHAHELADPNAADFDDFGWSVAIDGDTVVAGAPGEQGAVHVFTRNPSTGAWSHTQELADPNANADDLGWSVAIDGNTLVAGAPLDVPGTVHVFTRNPATGAWARTQELADPNAADYDLLGSSVAMEGDTLIAGAPESTVDAVTLADQGAVHVFTGEPRGTVSGTVSHADGSELLGAVEVMVGELAAGGELVNMRFTCTTASGEFTVGGLPLGADLVAGVSGVNATQRCPNREFRAGNRYLSQYFEAHDGVRVFDVFQVTEADPVFRITFALRRALAGEWVCLGELVTKVGTAGDDILNGTPGRDVIAARAGNDLIAGRGDDDVICAGPGDDTVYGGGGNDSIKGGGGDDRLVGGGGNDQLYAGPGRDILGGRGGNDLLWGGSGDDRLYGGPGTDSANGGIGTDRCRAETVKRC